jgi:YkoY family integral membrane protein
MITTIFIFLNILLIELILSVDNAAALAIVVNKNLPDENLRKKALRYGILGAYIFRGLSLLLVSYIIYNPSIGAWFKIVGGFYLIYLFYTHLTPEADSAEEGEVGWLEKICKYFSINKFWTTVIMVEFLDIVFSMDNLVACVSLSSNIYIVCGAVFVGILGMRFVAQYFSGLLLKFPSLESSAFYVILLLGIKMFVAGIFDFFPGTVIHTLLNSHSTDLAFSVITLLVFIFPILKNKFK